MAQGESRNALSYRLHWRRVVRLLVSKVEMLASCTKIDSKIVKVAAAPTLTDVMNMT